MACGSKSSDNKAKPGKSVPVIDAAASPVPSTDAARKRVTGPTRAAVDCATLLTIDDVARLCGPAVRTLNPTKTEKAGRNCSRAGGSFNARLMFMLTIGTGDVGHPAAAAKVHKQTVGGANWHTVSINKKPFELQLRATHHEGKKPPCDPAQLDALAKLVVSRLP